MAHGAPFIWYELLTEDPDGATAFYEKIVDWEVEWDEPEDSGGVQYRHFKRHDHGSTAGMLYLTPRMVEDGARPCWLPYLYVGDIDATLRDIGADGGRVLMAKVTIPVGSFALVSDPQGVPFYVMTPLPVPGHRPNTVFSPSAPRFVRWNELATPDLENSLAFYRKHFGIESNDRMNMGSLGDYCFIEKEGVTLGAMFPRLGDDRPLLWLLYFGVPSIVAAHTAVRVNGGQVLMGPHEVPGGDWILICKDPQGVMFGLVGPKGE